MSDSHHEPAHDHGHAEEHGHGDDHGHGHDHDGGDSPWSDYNAKPPAPSTLPALGAPALAVMGLVLAGVLTLIVSTSLCLAGHAAPHGEHGHADAADENHQPEKAH